MRHIGLPVFGAIALLIISCSRGVDQEVVSERQPPTPSGSSSASELPLAYYSETEWHDPLTPHALYRMDLHQVDSDDPLELRLTFQRVDDDGLTVRIEIWNLSDEIQRVVPIRPGEYHVGFKQENGSAVRDVFRSQPTMYELQIRDELVEIWRGNVLVSHFHDPAFFTKVSSESGLSARASISLNYALDETLTELERFELDTGWVPVEF